MRAGIAAVVLGIAFALAGEVAHAAVISGPSLTLPGNNFSDTGLSFEALTATTLTQFTFENRGAADTIVLTDSSGKILDSVNTPAGVPSDVVNVDWSLSSGDTYFLLQTVLSNELFAGYGQSSFPSDTDIAITVSGTFADSINAATTNQNFPANAYWAAFNDITTGVSVTPIPSAWTTMLLGLACLGIVACRRRRRGGALVTV
jgi:hypothetical protein